MVKKPSIGRQKIKIQKIEVKNHLQVTFSKRRSGLFKKASELCTLCGVEIAIIVFSPAGKVFSFGHPNVDSIIDRFIRSSRHNHNSNSNSSFQDPLSFHLMEEAQRNVSVRELNLQLGQIQVELDVERSKGENLESMRKTSQSHYWWEAPVGKLGLEELEQLRDAMEDLKKTVCHHVAKLLNPSSIYVPSLPPPGTIFDQYETKPAPGLQQINGGANFGYCIGYF